MKRLSLIVLVLALLAIVLQGPLSAVDRHRDHPGAAHTGCVTASGLAYHDLWRKLWEDHITWTRNVIVSFLDGSPGFPDYAGRLLQNPGDMADALRPYYGDAAADQFEQLVTEHLTIAVELLTAAKAGDTAAFEDAHARWYANGEEIAALMTRLNPRSWPLAEAERMWEEHLDVTLAQAVGHLTGDFEAEVEAYDHGHHMALEMADFFSNGVIRQFPKQFRDGHR